MVFKNFAQLLHGTNRLLRNVPLPTSLGLRSILKLSRSLHSSKIFKKNTKLEVTMAPEIESLFDEGLKFRKHPGKLKSYAIKLPEKLLEIVEVMLADVDNTELLLRKKELDNYLYSRRLPMEQLELQKRTIEAMEKLDMSEDMLYADDDYSKKKVWSLQKKLRCEINRWRPLGGNDFSCLVYMVSRMAGNYAATYQVLNELKSTLPDFEPKNYFDFGMGVGSSLWATNAIWESSIKEYYCVDTSAEMNDICQHILQGGKEEAPMLIPNVNLRQFFPTSTDYCYDLIVSSFTLIELPSAKERLRAIDILWRKTKDCLVLIENGTLAGFSAVIEARDYILKLEEAYNKESPNVHIVAPCPHLSMCPKLGSRMPCTFPVTYFPFYPKKDCLSTKKELFSYVILRKGQRDSRLEEWPRIVQQVTRKSKMAFCRLCCADGQLHDIIFTKGRHPKPIYQCAKNGKHGDRLPVIIKEVELPDEEDNVDVDTSEFSDENLNECKHANEK